MTIDISRRATECLKTAHSLLRVAKTMTDQAIAYQLKVLAENYERRAEKASRVDTEKALARAAADAQSEAVLENEVMLEGGWT
ncbi:hypothetical protein [Bradyrhizobium sp. DASA03120]|uniref:hypothetical protein n=1 Tax=Bradyrhizobium sp. SMVTL-02 TaxID=3395917 RepID=UPI003F6F8B47